MQYRLLGRTGVRVSSLCMGTMSFGGDADQKSASAMYRRCRDAGINFFDTANVYAEGRSEKILGQLMEGHRDEIVVASKVGFPVGQEVNSGGLSRRHILQSVEASLNRLGTDHLDLLFLHRYDPAVAIEEPLRALDDLVRQGKVLYTGASNWAAWQTATALGIAARLSLPRFECLEPMYNLVKRQAEVEILPLAEEEQMGVIAYNPLGGGLLSGKYGVERRPKKGRLVEDELYAARYGDPAYYQVAGRFAAYAQEHGHHPVSLAIAWVMSHPAVTAPILGARDVEQLEPALGAVEIEISPEQRAEISELSIEPPPATDRSESRKGLESRGARSR
jgi:aryl-alcohol dehydrogenase-like predicted oxidoreductase